MPYLYLIKSGEYHKIGIASDVRSRMAQLQTGNPIALVLESCYEFDNPQPVEQSLHQRFDSKNQNGEWFLLDETDRELFQSICAMLGGVRLADFNVTVTQGEVEDADALTNEVILKPRDDSVYDDEGYRLELNGSGKYKRQYYIWQRSSGENREYKPGGKVSDLPKDIQAKIKRRVEYEPEQMQETNESGTK